MSFFSKKSKPENNLGNALSNMGNSFKKERISILGKDIMSMVSGLPQDQMQNPDVLKANLGRIQEAHSARPEEMAMATKMVFEFMKQTNGMAGQAKGQIRGDEAYGQQKKQWGQQDELFNQGQEESAYNKGLRGTPKVMYSQEGEAAIPRSFEEYEQLKNKGFSTIEPMTEGERLKQQLGIENAKKQGQYYDMQIANVGAQNGRKPSDINASIKNNIAAIDKLLSPYAEMDGDPLTLLKEANDRKDPGAMLRFKRVQALFNENDRLRSSLNGTNERQGGSPATGGPDLNAKSFWSSPDDKPAPSGGEGDGDSKGGTSVLNKIKNAVTTKKNQGQPGKQIIQKTENGQQVPYSVENGKATKLPPEEAAAYTKEQPVLKDLNFKNNESKRYPTPGSSNMFAKSREKSIADSIGGKINQDGTILLPAMSDNDLKVILRTLQDMGVNDTSVATNQDGTLTLKVK